MVSMSRSFSHSEAKLVTSDRDFSFWQHHARTCPSNTLGSLSLPCSATASSSSSGTVLHKKKERRDRQFDIADAIVLRPVQGLRAAVQRDGRNLGLAIIAMIPFWIPPSKVPEVERPSLKNASGGNNILSVSPGAGKLDARRRC